MREIWLELNLIMEFGINLAVIRYVRGSHPPHVNIGSIESSWLVLLVKTNPRKSDHTIQARIDPSFKSILRGSLGVVWVIGDWF